MHKREYLICRKYAEKWYKPNPLSGGLFGNIVGAGGGKYGVTGYGDIDGSVPLNAKKKDCCLGKQPQQREIVVHGQARLAMTRYS